MSTTPMPTTAMPTAAMPTSGAVVVAARRTPIGTAGRSFGTVTVDQLAAAVIGDLVADARLDGHPVDHVVLGNCLGPGGNLARVAVLRAGLDVATPAFTVDRQCGSGLEAVCAAARLVCSGEADRVLAGGAESASTAPWRFWPPERPGAAPRRYERAPFAPPELGDPEMGLAADRLAEEYAITRRDQDAYAARSHTRAVAARDTGAFDAEIVPVAGVCRDDRPRTGLDFARLSRLRPAFDPGGTVTAGNSCGVNDGAALVTVVSEALARRRGLPGLRILAGAAAGVDPSRPGLGVVPAVRAVLGRTGLTLADVDVVEINEAFAAQVLAGCAELRLDPERVCLQGGAIAFGHPWGASGAVLLVRLFQQLLTGRHRLGLAAIAVGGGQGVAMLVEALC